MFWMTSVAYVIVAIRLTFHEVIRWKAFYRNFNHFKCASILRLKVHGCNNSVNSVMSNKIVVLILCDTFRYDRQNSIDFYWIYIQSIHKKNLWVLFICSHIKWTNVFGLWHDASVFKTGFKMPRRNLWRIKWSLQTDAVKLKMCKNKREAFESLLQKTIWMYCSCLSCKKKKVETAKMCIVLHWCSLWPKDVREAAVLQYVLHKLNHMLRFIWCKATFCFITWIRCAVQNMLTSHNVWMSFACF